MEKCRRLDYTLRHEASRNRTAAGTAAPTGDPAAQGGQEPVGGGSRVERVGELGLPLGPSVPGEGLARVAAPADSGAPARALPRPAGAAEAHPPARPAGRRLSDGPLDAHTRCGGHQASVRCHLSSLSCLETPAPVGLELPETGAAGAPTERRGDRALETVPMAAYKKTPQGVEPISCSLMNQASC